MTVSILHERSEVADCLPLVRCAIAMSAGMAALHLLGKTTSHSTRLQKAAAKSLVIPQTAGYAITSDLASVVCSPSRMASSFISNVPARGRPMGTPLLCSDPFALSEVRPRHGGAEPSGAGVAALHLLPQTAGYASNVSEVQP